jgi:hypothetical protein
VDERQGFRVDGGAGQQAVDDAHVSHVDAQVGDARRLEAFECQLLGLEVGFQPGVAVNFGAELQRLAGGVGRSVRVCSTGPQ